MTRIHGLDLARALAIIGMMAAHIGPEHFLTDGYPSVLFAVLAGVSMGIIAARSTSPAEARVALLTRAVLLVGLGVLLEALQFGIVVVLTAIGVSYLLLLPVLRWRTRWWVMLLAVLVVLGPGVGAAQGWFYIVWGSEFLNDLLYGPYPLTAWLAYLLVGLLIHRLALQRDVLLLVLGLSLFALVQGIIMVTDFRVGEFDALNVAGAWLQGEPHTGGLLDILTSAGLAAAVIGACLLACRVAAIVWVTYPLRSFGAMSLTIYVTHVIITTLANGTFVGTTSMYDDTPAPYTGPADFGWTMYAPVTDSDSGTVYADPLWPDLFLWQLVGFLIFASLWRWRFRRGPAEWVVARTIAGTVSEPR